MIYKMELTTEEMNVVRNALSFVLENNNLSEHAINWYSKVKEHFESEYKKKGEFMIWIEFLKHKKQMY